MSRKHQLNEVTSSKSTSVNKFGVITTLDEGLSTAQWTNFLNVFSNAEENDPILLLKWNSEWIDNKGEKLRDEVIEFILNNGGSDPEDSGFIFHFKATQDMLSMRDALEETIVEAFHERGGIPMAEAWVVYKTAVLANDYKKDSKFFRL